MKIRCATNDDIELLAGLVSQSFKDVAVQFGLTPGNAPSHPSNCAPEWIVKAFDKGVRYYILEDDGNPCGCVAMEVAGDDFCYLERLAVLPEHRRQGFGRVLVDHIVSEARALGLNRIEIAIIAEHTDLRRWYESQGFVLTSTKSFPQLPFEVAFMALALGG